MTLLVYCAWETRVMRPNRRGKKEALRVIRMFWSDSESDRFEAQVLDCVSIVLNFAPSLTEQVGADQIEVCKSEKVYRMPARTAYGRQFLSACIALGLIEPKGLTFGGTCGGQFGWPTQQLHSVDIRLMNVEDSTATDRYGFVHWYSVSNFTQEQLEWLLSGGVIRHTFGIFDVDAWEIDEVFEMIEY